MEHVNIGQRIIRMLRPYDLAPALQIILDEPVHVSVQYALSVAYIVLRAVIFTQDPGYPPLAWLIHGITYC